MHELICDVSEPRKCALDQRSVYDVMQCSLFGSVRLSMP